MRYIIDNENIVSEKEFYERLEEEIRYYVDENYDDILDEVYEEYKIGYLSYPASEVLKRCDPIAYNCGIDDEIDYRLSEAKYELEHNGETYAGSIRFEIIDTDEDEEEEEDE